MKFYKSFSTGKTEYIIAFNGGDDEGYIWGGSHFCVQMRKKRCFFKGCWTTVKFFDDPEEAETHMKLLNDIGVEVQ